MTTQLIWVSLVFVIIAVLFVIGALLFSIQYNRQLRRGDK